MVWLWERGHDRNWVLSLTLKQINDLYEVCQRLEARDKVDSAWMTMTAAQGTAKNMKSLLKPFTDLLKRSRLGKQQDNDREEFLRKFGKGF